MRRTSAAVAALLAGLGATTHGAAVQSVDAAASAPPRHAATHPRAAVPAANFLVEWRIQPVGAGAASSRGDVVITSNGAATGGATGYGPGAVVVGTARVAAPQALRVSNGREGQLRFDDSTTRTVYDMSYASTSSSDSSTDAASGATTGGASRARSRSRDRGVTAHEVVVHRVDGLRVTPHWTRGDTLALDIQLTHGGPAAGPGTSGADAGATREFDFTSTVQVSFDEWQAVANVGDGGEELQVRVTWR